MFNTAQFEKDVMKVNDEEKMKYCPECGHVFECLPNFTSCHRCGDTLSDDFDAWVNPIDFLNDMAMREHYWFKNSLPNKGNK